MSGKIRTVRTICQGCHCECGVLVTVEDGKVKKIEGDPNHPMNRGFTCVKGRAYHEVVHHPDRLKYPMKRIGAKGEGKWQRITWDQALNEIAQKLTEIKEKYGPEAIATIHGTGPRPTKQSLPLLLYSLNSPNRVDVDLHICYVPSFVAEICTYGTSITQEIGPDYPNANCIVVWGANPLASHPPKGKEIVEAKKERDAKLIVVDPRKTPLAAMADVWLQVRPGTDCALALGMLNVIVEEGLYDRDFVEKWCFGFDKLKEHVKNFPPAKVAEITWVSASDIQKAARLYATTKPATLHHRVAIEHNIGSVQTIRALAIMIALTGNIDVKGGNLLPTLIKGFKYSSMLQGFGEFRPDPEVERKRIGAREYPLISGPESVVPPFVHGPLFIDTLITGKPYLVKALICAGGNPVVNLPNTKRVWDALKKLDLLVVMDFFMTPTAELADYVLPATTWLERDECCDMMYTNYISARQKAIEPLYECWDDMKMAIELVKRIPWANRKFLPWNSVEEFNEWRLKDVGMTFQEFKEKGTIVAPPKYKKYAETGFKTPTGKVELYSTIFEKHGYDPLPTYEEPPESPISTPELMKEYPYILITGGRHVEYFHSEGRQIPTLRKLVPDPEVEIHPETAKKLRIKDGDWVWIETPQIRGERAKFKVKLTENIHPLIIHARHGWWFPERPHPDHGCFDSNINVTLSGEFREPICGSIPIRGTLCKVYKV